MRIGLYLHFPFCLQKCHYCAFNSLPLSQTKQGSLVAKYIDSLKKEIALYTESTVKGTALELASVYCGGGTPTVVPIKDLCDVLSHCRSSFPLSPDPEITVEANPGTVNPRKLQFLRDVGVNRLSLGAQSFHPHELRLLGRTHGVAEIIAAYENARKAGFDNLNLDLIYGLPGQSLTSWKDSLEQALSLRPEHLSIYGLSLEAGTPLARDVEQGLLEACAEEAEIAMWEETALSTAAAGYQRYEISNYARPGFECKHNISYWRNTPYLGMGVSAQGYYGGVRYANEDDLTRYIAKVSSGELPRLFEEKQTAEQERVDTIIMGLRLTKGLSKKDFQKRFGFPFEYLYQEELTSLHGLGLIDISKDAVFLTDRGRLVANDVLSYFV